jgi:hypothetical protein
MNVAIALGEDFRVYLIDIINAEVVFILWPNILTCDKAKSICLHPDFSYLMEVYIKSYIDNRGWIYYLLEAF